MPNLTALVAALHSNQELEPALGPVLEALAFRDSSKARSQLATLRNQTSFHLRYPHFFQEFLKQLSGSYDPDLALNNFLRLSENIQDKEHLYSQLTTSPKFLRALVVLFSGSQVLTESLLANPAYLDWLHDPETLEKPKTRDDLYRDFYSMAGGEILPDNTPALLRRFKKREYIRIGILDLLGAVTLQENVGNLSDLADVCLQVAYEFSLERLKQKHGVPVFEDEDGSTGESEFAILSMGKLGGRELNYSSDIDLIYIYTSSQGETKPIEGKAESTRTLSIHEFHTKLGQMITSTLNDITPDGNVFRVDLDLRPQGRSGEIANSLSRCETYYQSWGRTWERQALIKARVSAGSEELGQQFFEMIAPFIYRRSLDFSAVEEIKGLKAKVDGDLVKRKKEKGHIKLGAGGIREIEFLVQAYQLLFGGRDNNLRNPNTLMTLEALWRRGFINEEDYRHLREAYVFLRNLENRVQISLGLQTYHLPKEDAALAVLARKMGIDGHDEKALVARLMDEFDKHTGHVRMLYANLFEEASDQKSAENAQQAWSASRTLESRFSPELFQSLRHADPERIFRFLKSLRDGPGETPASEKSVKIFYEILPSLLDKVEEIPRPGNAIENLVKFVEASHARDSLLNLFSQNENVLELFLILFGSSEVLSSILIKAPNLMDVLMSPESLYRYKTPAQIAAELKDSLKKAPDAQARKLVLRRLKQAEELRVGMRYLIHETDLPSTLEDLAALADLYLETSLELALAEERRESGRSEGETDGFAIIGMGKLGGSELNFGSDLDLLFVYEEPETGDAMTRYSTISHKIYQYCSEMTEAGIAYKVDTDLRPEGSQGTLVLSLKGYEDYFESRGRIWEQQAMTRARFVAGNRDLGKRFLDMAHRFAFGSRLEYESLIEIARLRERMEKELAQEETRGRNVKLGFGGLADIEFAVQVLQLMHGGRNRQLRETNTLTALGLFGHLGIVDDQDIARLKKHYLFLRNLECALRLQSIRGENHLPKKEEDLDALARLVGLREGESGKPAEELMKRYEKVTRQVRELYRKTIDVLLRTAR